MGFSEAIKSVFSQYASITGRASRSEYWYFQLFLILTMFVLYIIMLAVPLFSIISILFTIGTFIPSLTVSFRRLHDKDKSAWWYLIGLIPVVGALLLLYWFVTKGTEGPNQFGDDPLGHPGDVFD